ncbi:MAG: hypothetical protein ACRDDH_09335 [Cetobacterium sp.]|uniref:hypothetical protein n=1 Tax=Cetobacterium sp. TaxID=2071632 RepID=UPI003EE81B07
MVEDKNLEVETNVSSPIQGDVNIAAEEFYNNAEPMRHVDKALATSITPGTVEEQENYMYYSSSLMNDLKSKKKRGDSGIYSTHKEETNLNKAFEFTAESFNENARIGVLKVAQTASDVMRAGYDMITGDDLNYEGSIAHIAEMSSDNPETRRMAQEKVENSKKLKQLYDESFAFENTKFRREQLDKLALSRELQQSIIESIDNTPFRTATSFVGSLIGATGDFVEVAKGVAVNTLVAPVGAAFGLGKLATFGIDLAVGGVESYFTAGWENNIGVQDFTEEEKFQNILTGMAFQGVISGAKELGGKFVKPVFKNVMQDSSLNISNNKNVINENTPVETIKVNVNDIRLAESDNMSGFETGTTKVMEGIIDKGVDQNGNFKYSSQNDDMINTTFSNMKSVSGPDGTITGYTGQTRYKNKDVFIETPSHITMNDGTPAAQIAALRSFEEAKTARIYTLDENGEKIALTGTDKANAYRTHMMGENTVNATFDSIVSKEKKYQRVKNAERAKNRAIEGSKAAKDNEKKIAWAERESVKKAIYDGIITPLDTAKKSAQLEFDLMEASAASDFGGNPIRLYESKPNGQFAKYWINGIDPEVDTSGLHKMINAYTELDKMIFADSKSKVFTTNADQILKSYPGMFEGNPDGSVKLRSDFIEKTGGDMDSVILDLAINKDLSIEKGSHIAEYGFTGPDDVMDVLGLFGDTSAVNGAGVSKMKKIFSDDISKKILEDSGLFKLDENGIPSLSMSEFFEGVRNLGKNISDGIDVDQSKNILKSIFGTEDKLFPIKDKTGAITGYKSLADIVSDQIEGVGSSFNAVKKALKPIEDAITSSLNKINKDISVFEKAKDLQQGVKDIKQANGTITDIIADLIPDFRPGDMKGKSLQQMVDGAIAADPEKVAKTFKSSSFKKKIENLRELDNKYNFLEDKTLLDSMDIDNLLDAEKVAKINTKSKVQEFETESNISKTDIENKISDIVDKKTEELNKLRESEKGIYDEVLAERTETKRIELENSRENRRTELEAEQAALDSQIKAMEDVKVEIDTDAIQAVKDKIEKLKSDAKLPENSENKAEIKSTISDLKKSLKSLENPKTNIDKKQLGVLKRKLTILDRDLVDFDNTYDTFIEKSLKELTSSRNKDVFGVVNARKAEVKAQKEAINLSIKEAKDGKRIIAREIQSLVKDVKKAKSLDGIKEIDVKTRIDKIKNISAYLEVEGIDLDLDKVTKGFENIQDIQGFKNATADEAIQTVAAAFKSVMEQAKGLNEKVYNNKKIEIKAIKDQYGKVISEIKSNSKKDFTSVYDKVPVQKSLDRLMKMVEKADIFENIEDILPSNLMSFHKQILDKAKLGMETGTILKPGERARRKAGNKLGTQTAKMSRLAQMIDQSMFGNDKTFFQMGKINDEVPDYKIAKFLKEADPTKNLSEFEDFSYQNFVREDMQPKFEMLYEKAKDYFGEIEGVNGEVRDMDINEFALMYWDFLQDLSYTRGDVSKWEPENKKTISQLIPYFKDEDAMIDFMTIHDPEIDRVGFVKTNDEVMKHMNRVSDKGSEYNAIGMTKESLLGLSKNTQYGPLKDAMDKLDVQTGESKSGSGMTEYYNLFEEYLNNAFEGPGESTIPRIILESLGIMYQNALHGSGTKEYLQTGEWHTAWSNRILAKDLDAADFAKRFRDEFPRQLINTVRSIPYMFKETGAMVRNMLQGTTEAIDYNKMISKYPHLKSANKYIQEIIQKEIGAMNTNRHRANADRIIRRRTGNNNRADRMASYAKGMQDYAKDTGYYLQHDNDFNKNMLSHETAYEAMTQLSEVASFDDIKSNHLKSILTNTGVTPELFGRVQSFLRKNTDSEGAINLAFYDFNKMRDGLSVEDTKLAQVANGIYSAVFNTESTLNKDAAFATGKKTVMDLIQNFLKNTTKGISGQEIFHLSHKIDDAGNYISRYRDAKNSGSKMYAASQAGKSALFLTNQAMVKGVSAIVGTAIYKMYVDPMKIKKNVSEFWASLSDKNDEEIDTTTPLGRISRFALRLLGTGVTSSPAAGVAFSGGNPFSDTATRSFGAFSRYMSGEGEPLMKELKKEWGIGDDVFMMELVGKSVFKTALNFYGPTKFLMRNGASFEELIMGDSDANIEIKRQNEIKQIQRNVGDSKNRQQVGKSTYNTLNQITDSLKGSLKKTFFEGLSLEIDKQLTEYGGLMHGVSDEIFAQGDMTQDEYKEFKSGAFELMGVKDKMYDKIAGKAKTIGDGTLKLMNFTDKLDELEFKYMYSQGIASGLDPMQIVQPLIDGPSNAPLIMEKGQAAYSRSQKALHLELKADWDMTDKQIEEAIASNPGAKDTKDYVVEKYKPVSKEAKYVAKGRDLYNSVYTDSQKALSMVDKFGAGLFTSDYLQYKGLNVDPKNLGDDMKKTILREDYYDPLRDYIKNDEATDQLFPVAVALGSSYVGGVYKKMNGNMDKTLDYIYAARFEQKDFDGKYAEFIDLIKNGSKDEPIPPDDDLADIMAEIEAVDPNAWYTNDMDTMEPMIDEQREPTYESPSADPQIIRDIPQVENILPIREDAPEETFEGQSRKIDPIFTEPEIASTEQIEIERQSDIDAINELKPKEEVKDEVVDTGSGTGDSPGTDTVQETEKISHETVKEEPKVEKKKEVKVEEKKVAKPNVPAKGLGRTSVPKTGQVTLKTVAETPEKETVLKEIYKDFGMTEGHGDKTGAAKTGALGMTVDRRAALETKYGRKLKDSEATYIYTSEMYDKITSINPKLNKNQIKSLISSAYNLGHFALDYPGWRKYMENPTDANLENAYFDTATIEKKSSRGLARRRALDYNLTNPKDPVTHVEQVKDGALKYHHKSGRVSTVKGNGKIHKDSGIGMLPVGSY